MQAPLPILVLPLDTPPECIAEARFAGYLPVLTNEPDKVRVVMQEHSADRHHMLMAALKSIDGGFSQRSQFFNHLYERIKE